MKKAMIALAFAAFASLASYAQAPQAARADNKNAPRFEFAGGETHDFGTITDAKDAEYTFSFRNKGREPLVITNASASCSCTVPEFPKEPILPGKEGKIKVVFHAPGKSGAFDKTVFIQSNAVTDKDRYEIHIKGTVTPASQPQATPQSKG